MMKRLVYLSVVTIAASASLALAGTKYQANIVTASAASPATNPTLLPGKLSLQDTGKVQGALKGVTDSGGLKVTSIQPPVYINSVKAKLPPALDGSEYVVILKATFTALGLAFELPIPVDLKNGNGVTNLALSSLVTL